MCDVQSSWGETSPPHIRLIMGGGKTPWSTKPPPTGPSPEQETVHRPPGWSGQILSPPGFVVQILLPKVPQSFSIINGSGPDDLYLTKIKHTLTYRLEHLQNVAERDPQGGVGSCSPTTSSLSNTLLYSAGLVPWVPCSPGPS